MPKSIIVTCHHCRGTGKAPLQPHLKQTLDALTRRKQATAEQLWTGIMKGCVRSAMNRRLEELRLLGLVKRERQGRNFIYSAA